MKIEVTIDGDIAAAMQQAPQTVSRFMNAALWRGAEEFARAERQAAPKAFSSLANSIHARQIGDLHFRVSTGASHARPVEEGRQPGKQPGISSGLMEWVKLKIGVDGKELDRVTFLIARAIGRRGIKPQPYAAPTVETMESRVIQLVRDAAINGLQESVNAAR